MSAVIDRRRYQTCDINLTEDYALPDLWVVVEYDYDAGNMGASFAEWHECGTSMSKTPPQYWVASVGGVPCDESWEFDLLDGGELVETITHETLCLAVDAIDPEHLFGG